MNKKKTPAYKYAVSERWTSAGRVRIDRLPTGRYEVLRNGVVVATANDFASAKEEIPGNEPFTKTITSEMKAALSEVAKAQERYWAALSALGVATGLPFNTFLVLCEYRGFSDPTDDDVREVCERRNDYRRRYLNKRELEELDSGRLAEP